MGYYDRYRGTKRKARQNRLLVVSVVLLLVIVISLAILVLGDFITYSANGFHFSWGSQQKENGDPIKIPDDDSGSADDNSDKDSDFVIDDDSDKQEFTLANGQTGSKLTLPSLFLELEGTLPSPLNGYAVWVKDSLGNRYLPSAIDNYNENGLWEYAASIPGQVSALNATDGLHTIAMITAFCDPVLPYKAYGASAIDAGNEFWTDFNGAAWLDPATAGGSIIVIEMVKRCKAAGFDEILLTDFCYPTDDDGDVSTITSVVERDKISSITSVAKQAKNVLGNSNIKLSCLLTPFAVQTMTDAAAGQDVAKLAQYIDCFYVQTDAPDPDLTALKAMLADSDSTIALWYTGIETDYPTEYDFITVPQE